MPSAAEVAAEREREQATNRDLQLLRLEHVADPAVLKECATRMARPPHRDSSGSEGDCLAAAVTALRVPATLPARKDGATTAADFLAALRAQLPYPDDRLLGSYLDVLKSNPRTVIAVTNNVSFT